jgi:hypothetical protein
MSEKILITSDGTVEKTTVKIDGNELTKTMKVTNARFYVTGGYEYVSTYSGNTIVVEPSVNYSVDYIDGDKMKSISLGSVDTKTDYGAVGQVNPKDSISFVGIKDEKDTVKTKLVEALDKMRTNHPSMPTKDILDKRTVESLTDKYTDLMIEDETKAKIAKDKK